MKAGKCARCVILARVTAAALAAAAIASPARGQCEYEVTMILAPDGPFGPPGTAGWGMNELGHVAGSYFPLLEEEQAFFWTQQDGFQSLPVLPGYVGARAVDINDAGDVVGWMITEGSLNHHGVLWRDGEVIELGFPPTGNSSQGHALNESGRLVGQWANTIMGPLHGFIWEDGELHDLGPTLGTDYSSADDIDRDGRIVGWMGESIFTSHAFLLEGDDVLDLGLFPGTVSTKAKAVSDHGWIVGYGVFEIGGRHAFLWREGTILDLGVLPGNEWSLAWDVNAVGQIVGYCNKGLPEQAFFWQNGVMYDVDSLIPVGLGIDTYDALAINNAGQILCGAQTPSEANTIILTPVRVAGDVDIDCHVGIFDLLFLLSEWGPCDGCPADLNRDGTVDVLDLLLVLQNWS